MAKEKKKEKKKGGALKIVLILLAVILAVTACVGAVFVKRYRTAGEFTVLKASEIVDRDVTLVAHRGFRAVAPENTAPAFEQAGLAGFDGAECDVYMTSDGVWVISHDPNMFKMSGNLSSIESSSLAELKEIVFDYGSNIEDYPDVGICAFDEYLEICKKYDMFPVIELKSDKNTERFDTLIQSLEKYELSDKAVFISFNLENLKKMRALSDAPLYYLVNDIDDEAINDALSLGGKCGIDFKGSTEEENLGEMIDKCVEKGLLLGAWTIDDPEIYKKLVNLNVTLITTDCVTH